MYITPITPNFTGNIVYRVSKQYNANTVRPYFYNEVLNIVREQKLSALIKGHNFDITFDTKYQQKNIKTFENTLNEAGIAFKQLV